MPGALYWGKYVAHDNNRDAMGVTLKLTENVLNTYVDWKAQVLHDLHESGSFLYDNTIGDGPYNAWLDPILTNEWQMIGWNNVNEMTRMGMPGVYAFGTFDTWSPGYLMFIAATHNGISRLYETFGNGGSADTVDRTLSPDRDVAHLVPAESAAAVREVVAAQQQQLRDDRAASSRSITSRTTALYFLRNFYEKSKRSITKARTEGPAAYVLPATDARLGRAGGAAARAAEAARRDLARDGGVHRAGAGAPAPARQRCRRARRPRGRARRARGGRRSRRQCAQPTRRQRRHVHRGPKPREFPAGSYIIRMDQPYSRIADALLDYQYWAPNDPQTTPVRRHRLDVPGRLRRAGGARARSEGARCAGRRASRPAVAAAERRRRARAASSRSITTPTTRSITLRYKLKSADIQMAEEPFEAAGQKFARGSFIIRGVSQARSRRGDQGGRACARYALAAAPTVKTHPARAARVALMHTWQSTQTEGWWRQALDFNGIPYDYISVQDVANERRTCARSTT